MEIKLIDITAKDFYTIKEIYDYYILNSTVTFHKKELGIEELKSVIPVGHSKYKSFLIYLDDELCGYCYISQYKNRPAYDRTAEITVYLKPEFLGRGIGSVAIKKLEEVAKRNAICVLIGVITEENMASTKLFERCGYEKCAHYKGIGEKFNRILDVVAYQKIISTSQT